MCDGGENFCHGQLCIFLNELGETLGQGGDEFGSGHGRILRYPFNGQANLWSNNGATDETRVAPVLGYIISRALRTASSPYRSSKLPSHG